MLSLYHQGQSTAERIVALLHDFGVSISKRQVVRILTSKVGAFVSEAKQVLEAGLASASWVNAKRQPFRTSAPPVLPRILDLRVRGCRYTKISIHGTVGG